MLNHWKETIESARDEFSDHVFNTWIKPIQYRTCADGTVCVAVPNNTYKEKIKKFYYPFLLEKYRSISQNHDVNISIVLQEKKSDSVVPDQKRVTIVKGRKKERYISEFQKQYTFDSFVVGNDNRLAFAASQNICDAPGAKFNPLLIYGGVGLGKTHLLNAIGNHFVKHSKDLSVVYKTSEQFMNELVQSIRFEKMDAFRNRYRHCDVLLIDDIQFLAGKERTQEEFFHTFNVLFQEGKQIALTSDRMPSEIPDLDNRLRSRFQSGLFCDIQSPDLETRMAIIAKKADVEGLSIPQEVVFFLAQNIQSNVRVIEGAMIRLCALASLHGKDVSLTLAQNVVSSMCIEEKQTSFDQILKTVADFYHIKVSDLKSSRRKKNIAHPRQIAMFLTRKHTDLSFPELGHRFGGKDHTTIMHGVSKVSRELTINENMQNTLAAIEKNLITS